MQPRDWTLLVIAAAQGEPLQPVQLQKALFMLSRNLTPAQRKSPNFYNFTPYDFGPFCQAVYADAEALEAEGLVHIRRPSHQSYREYAATTMGLEEAARLKAKLHPDVRSYLDRLMTWMRRLSFDQLVRAIYAKYPEMKVNSVFVA